MVESEFKQPPLDQKITVLGGAGFIGSHTVELFYEKGYRNLTVIDSFSEKLYGSKERRKWSDTASKENLAKFLNEDYVSDLSLDVCSNSDVVINLAAVAGLRQSWATPMDVIDVNFLKFNRLVDHLSSVSKPIQLIQASTSSVYGTEAIGDEFGPRHPVSPYGASKLGAELKLESLDMNSKLSWVGLRFFSVYGPRQRSDMAFHRAIMAAINKESFTLYGNGEQARSNTFVRDAASAVFQAFLRKPDRAFLNIAGTQVTTLNDALEVIEHTMGLELSKSKVENAPGDQALTKGDIERASSILGWRPVTTLEEGLRMQIEHLTREIR